MNVAFQIRYVAHSGLYAQQAVEAAARAEAQGEIEPLGMPLHTIGRKW